MWICLSAPFIYLLHLRDGRFRVVTEIPSYRDFKLVKDNYVSLSDEETAI